MQNVTELLLALVLGVALGAAVSRLVWQARGGAAQAEARAADEHARAEAALSAQQVADARSEAADARSEAANARAEAARASVVIAQARGDAAEARTEAATALAEVAALSAAVGKAEAQRDAAQKRAEELAADREALVKEFKVLSAESLERQGKSADATAEQRLKATEQLMAPVRASLEAFNARLTEVEKERVAMATDLRAQVQAVQLTGEQLRTETRALATALRKPHVRGHWGEQQLKRVVEIAGMVEHCDFLLQDTATTSADATIRPDMKVLLSDHKFVYVDSKMPLSAFLDAQETEDERDREHHLELFARNVRTHVDQLSSKSYFKADTGTPEFVVLFMPSEALAAEALVHLPDLHEYAAKRSIILATPTTLVAMLRAIAYGWKQAALADSAAEVFRLGRELYDRLGIMGGHFDKVGRSLTAAVKAYNESVGSMESRVFATARKLRDLRVTDGELRELTGVEASVRPITAPELVEDAVQVVPMIDANGRRGRQRAIEAESAELVRGIPPVEDLVSEASLLEPPPAARPSVG